MTTRNPSVPGARRAAPGRDAGTASTTASGAGGPADREALTLANMGMVVDVARRFRARGMELDDLIQEGCLGLMRAAESYDPGQHGAQFSTYAHEYVHYQLVRATSVNASMIRFPVYLAALRRRFDRAKAEMVDRRRSSADGPWAEPTVEEVAERMGVDPRRLRLLDRARVACTSYSTSTLDAEEAGASEDQIFEERPPEAPLEIAEEMEGLYEALGGLPRFEAWLIRRRYRLDDAPGRPGADGRDDGPRTYRELQRECGLRVFRIKQIEREALGKLHRALASSPGVGRRLPLATGRPVRPSGRRATA